MALLVEESTYRSVIERNALFGIASFDLFMNPFKIHLSFFQNIKKHKHPIIHVSIKKQIFYFC